MSDSNVEIPDKLFFRIGEAADIVSVETHVLRYWESEFRMRPQRSKSGQRMYRRKDIERFLRIKQLVHEQGFTIAGARKALQGGGKATPSRGSARVSDAIDRIETARERIKGLRERLLDQPLTELLVKR